MYPHIQWPKVYNPQFLLNWGIGIPQSLEGDDRDDAKGGLRQVLGREKSTSGARDTQISVGI